MDLINEQVRHKSFGEGSVVGCDESYIEVRFPAGVKRFVYPDVFGTHLDLVDRKLAKKVAVLRKDIVEERQEKERELEVERAAQAAEQQRLLERERLIKNHKLSPVSQVAFWLDEEEQEKVFSEGRVFTGRKKSGADKGKPNRLVRLHHNSGCLITAREPDVPEKQRRVVGLFLVDESFIGRLSQDGYIPAHPEYTLCLSEEESRQLLFWNYYINKRYPNSMTWNSGRHRYFDNEWMAQILQDIVTLRKGSEGHKLANDILEYFCQVNRLKVKTLPKPNGALFRVSNHAQ